MKPRTRHLPEGHRCKSTACPLILAGLALVMPLLTRQAAGQTAYVTPEGSPAPQMNAPDRPWQSVRAAAYALPRPVPPGATVVVGPGVYREAFTFDRNATLTAPSGAATIGDLNRDVTASTTFRVYTWNTHLFGDNWLTPSWQDYERADRMGRYFGAIRETVDLVALCEVWDEDLFLGGDGAVGIRPLSGYPYEGMFTGTDPFRPGHSGLALMSLQPMSDPKGVNYGFCAASDCLSSKGFFAVTVVKEGFPIRIYNTHTQAGNDAEAIWLRSLQLQVLARDIQEHRAFNPSHAVMVMGDLNVIGETLEQYEFLRGLFGALGGRDAARQDPEGLFYQVPGSGDTLTSFNELAVYFDDDHRGYDQRLDYIWYFPSADGTVVVQPENVERVIRTGPFRTEDDFTSDEWSDHYAVRGEFTLRRLR